MAADSAGVLLARIAIASCLVVGGCGGSRPRGSSASGPEDPLLGAWWTRTGPDGDTLPCPLEVEVFADGTAELDYLNDDSEEKMCSFARVPVGRSPGDPPVVRFAGQLAACIFRREGDKLRLACEDRPDPPADFSSSVLLERRPVRALNGFEALVGTWGMTGYWTEPRSIQIAADGHIRFISGVGVVRITGDGLLAIELGGEVLRCRYRAIRDRLTMRCGAPGQPAPETLSAAGGPILETLVLRRLDGHAPGSAGSEGAVVVTPAGRAGDLDGDGLRDAHDRCPDGPEDFDDFEDADGCPDPDNDRDRVDDTSDLCPLVPETYNGRADTDGCPDVGAVSGDRDADGAPDPSDGCPDDPEDRDGHQDTDGCPEPDNDQDGILDPDDLCANDPEDLDFFQDEDGCPDLDDDRDGVPDARDLCPNQPEDPDSDLDDDGCPEP